MVNTTDDKPVSRQTLYQIASRHSRAAIERLVELMYSSNENVSVAASRALLNKTIPDLKRDEVVDNLDRSDATTETRDAKIQKIVETIMQLNS